MLHSVTLKNFGGWSDLFFWSDLPPKFGDVHRSLVMSLNAELWPVSKCCHQPTRLNCLISMKLWQICNSSKMTKILWSFQHSIMQYMLILFMSSRRFLNFSNWTPLLTNCLYPLILEDTSTINSKHSKIALQKTQAFFCRLKQNSGFHLSFGFL